MTPAECVETATRAGIRLWSEAGELRATAPKGSLTAELRNAFASQKAGIVALLGSQPAPEPAPEPAAPAVVRAPTRPVPGERCEKCGAVAWRMTTLGNWLCRCGRYWYARRPEAWKDGIPDPVPGEDGGCQVCGSRVFRGERCIRCEPAPLPPGVPEHACVRCWQVDVGPAALFCPESPQRSNTTGS